MGRLTVMGKCYLLFMHYYRTVSVLYPVWLVVHRSYCLIPGATKDICESTVRLLSQSHRQRPFVDGQIIMQIQFSCSVVSDSLRPHGLQHVRLPCPSLTPRAYSTHVHQVGDAIQPSHPLSSPSPPTFNPSLHQGLFQ